MKLKKTGKSALKRRNPVALNPLMRGGSVHKPADAMKRKERSRVKRDLKNDADAFNHAYRDKNDDTSHWQNRMARQYLSNLISTVLPVAGVIDLTRTGLAGAT